LWAWLIFFFTGLRYSVFIEEKLNPKRNYIFCPNHFSYLDIPMSAVAVKRNWRFMAKTELNTIPLLKIFFRTVDISVDRDKARKSFNAVLEARASLQHGYNLVVYPEGTIGYHPPQLLPFKNGPFRLAIETQKPVVPVTFPDNWQLLSVDGYKLKGKPGLSRIIIHKPIETAGLTMIDVSALRQKVHDIILSELKKYND
jgi:1-acyl-sn-glycerol-3-phosphate acyltransferase